MKSCVICRRYGPMAPHFHRYLTSKAKKKNGGEVKAIAQFHFSYLVLSQLDESRVWSWKSNPIRAPSSHGTFEEGSTSFEPYVGIK